MMRARGTRAPRGAVAGAGAPVNAWTRRLAARVAARESTASGARPHATSSPTLAAHLRSQLKENVTWGSASTMQAQLTPCRAPAAAPAHGIRSNSRAAPSSSARQGILAERPPAPRHGRPRSPANVPKPRKDANSAGTRGAGGRVAAPSTRGARPQAVARTRSRGRTPEPRNATTRPRGNTGARGDRGRPTRREEHGARGARAPGHVSVAGTRAKRCVAPHSPRQGEAQSRTPCCRCPCPPHIVPSFSDGRTAPRVLWWGCKSGCVVAC